MTAAQPADGIYAAAGWPNAAGPNVARATAGRYSGRFVRLGGRRIRPTQPQVYAADNQNQRFVVFFRYAHGGDRSRCGKQVLRVASEVIVSTGYGSGDAGCHGSLEVGPATALAAARFLGTHRQDRRPLARHVVGAFEPLAQHVSAGDQVTVRFKLHNPGAPVLHLVGGRNRGPRNNRFAFEVSRDGHPVAPIEAYDFGGLMGYRELASGADHTLEADLSAWADVSVPGRYEVRCSFETSFTEPGADPFEDDQRARLWDRRFTGTLRFTVRP